MTESAHEAHEALGLRLRELRRDAGLTGRRLAQLAGWHESKVSKIEYGKQAPSEADLRTWCAHTGSHDQLPDLIATLRNIEAAYMEWRKILGTGTRRRQKLAVKLEQDTTCTRWFEPLVIPGLLQTPEYAQWILQKVTGFYSTPDDVDAGVSARMERQRVLYHGNHRFWFVIAEQVLRTMVGDNEIMLGQLDRLLTLMSLPRISLGIVPADATYEAPIINGFVMFDNRLVQVETISAELNVTQPREIALYGRAFSILADQSVTGADARELIRRAIEARR
ncbi:helix-turn-helix domain-containing protein [Nocardia cyriacigeorgica]|uniref:Helix-turn-helix domain-containing protein n=1 Tax=Nocardia cyriacigeorgica TaxID=135487 RepID=A0A5R8NJX1_9NOCA|nr:helix-turn-helix transcriptional regulator [Nocardia cyriacigeorgica]TLF75913.1 helix-turn-helix domain-containing protein [Nocardia cyriacigeorgica]